MIIVKIMCMACNVSHIIIGNVYCKVYSTPLCSKVLWFMHNKLFNNSSGACAVPMYSPQEQCCLEIPANNV